MFRNVQNLVPKSEQNPFTVGGNEVRGSPSDNANLFPFSCPQKDFSEMSSEVHTFKNTVGMTDIYSIYFANLLSGESLLYIPIQ